MVYKFLVEETLKLKLLMEMVRQKNYFEYIFKYVFHSFLINYIENPPLCNPPICNLCILPTHTLCNYKFVII